MAYVCEAVTVCEYWAYAGFCFVVLIEQRGGVTHAFCLLMKKMDFYCFDSQCFCPYRFYSPSGVLPLPLTFILQAANTCYLFLSVNHEVFCVQVYLIVVDRLQCLG